MTTPQDSFTSSRGYLEFDTLIQRVEQGSMTAAVGFADYEPQAVVQRLVQRVVEIMASPYLGLAAHRHKSGQFVPLSESAIVSCGGLRLDAASGVVSPSFGIFLRALMEFAVHWCHVLVAYGRVALSGKPGRGPATLLYGVGIGDFRRGGNDARFVAYCRRGPILPLSQAQRLVAQVTADVSSTAPGFLDYTRFPLHTLATENPPGITGFLGFLRTHVRILGSYAKSVWRCPAMVLLGRDAAYHAIAASMNARNLIQAIVLTSTNYSAQPLWMTSLPDRKFQTHFVLYSTNSLPVMWAGEDRQVYLPPFRHMRADEAWVWNKWHGETLAITGIKTNVVGPILWYLPENLPSTSTSLCVAVFDVTPVTPAFGLKLGLIDNYYSAENMHQFISDIVEACKELEKAVHQPVKIVLKHKRSHSPIHDTEYILQIEQLVSRSCIELVAPETDLYTLIGGCDICLAIPFSSPAYVADSMQRPAIYYDPTGKVRPNFDSSGKVIFIQGRESLVQQMISIAENLPDKRRYRSSGL